MGYALVPHTIHKIIRMYIVHYTYQYYIISFFDDVHLSFACKIVAALQRLINLSSYRILSFLSHVVSKYSRTHIAAQFHSVNYLKIPIQQKIRAPSPRYTRTQRRLVIKDAFVLDLNIIKENIFAFVAPNYNV